MIDCHLHLQDPRLADSVAEIMGTVRALGIGRLVVNGTHPGDWDAVAALAAEHAEVIPSFGLHPWRVGGEPEGWLADLEARLVQHPGAGIGEIGLDRWIRGSDFGRQREVFAAQLDLAKRLERPVSIHCLRAWGALIEALDATGLERGPLLHSYGGPMEMVGGFAARGAFFSISGYFFRPGKERKLAAFDAVPGDRLLIESDAPDMAPPPEMLRHALADGNLNHPGNLVAVYEAVAARYGLGFEELVKRTRRNFEAWYGGGVGQRPEPSR